MLSPTRELAMQTFHFARTMAKFVSVGGAPLGQAPLVGGESIEGQFAALAKRPAALHATPGAGAEARDDAFKTRARSRVRTDR